MGEVRIKICGVRRREDVHACATLEVDLVGFNFWPRSKRYVTPAAARELAVDLPSGIARVGVFVNASPEEVRDIASEVGLTHAQLHGDERLEDYAHVGVPLIQVVKIFGPESLRTLALSGVAAELLLDAAVAGYGGAGARFDWSLASQAQRQLGRRVVLAGGLTPENVAEAIAQVSPSAVDVASGVERAPGEKDAGKLRAFVEAVRAAAIGTERGLE